MRIRAMVFDFDGTLARLTIDFALMKRKLAALASAFLPRPPAPGPTPALEWLDELAARIGAEDPDHGNEFHSRGRLVITAMELDAAKEGELFPGTRPLLAMLARRGVRTGIITRNCTAAVRRVFPDVRESCGVFVPREDAPRVKPDPAHLLAALAALDTPPHDALMVGDHPLDIETARRAGAKSAAVASGATGSEALSGAGPDFLAQDLRGLIDQLTARGLL